MAKLDIDVNRGKGKPKTAEGLGRKRPELNYDEDRERRFRQRMNGGKELERKSADRYEDTVTEAPKSQKSSVKSGKNKTKSKKESKKGFFERYGSVFSNGNIIGGSLHADVDEEAFNKKLMIFAVIGLVVLGIIMVIVGSISNARQKRLADEERDRQKASYEAWLNSASVNEAPAVTVESEAPESIHGLFPGYTLTVDSPAYINIADFDSEYAIIVDAATGKVIAEKNSTSIVSPASMTKMMTLLVATEHIPADKLDDKVTVTIEDTDYAYRNDLSSAGYDADEETTVRDLMYGTILPSGGEASHALAVYVSGSEEAFVQLMNQKAAELGLSNTHFTNVSGYYNENHYSTVSEVAIIMKACMENDLCREVMSAHIYTTTPTEQHPDGLEISNWFLRRIEDKYDAGLVFAAKTGYVVNSGNCSASFNQMPSGNEYICVTVNASSVWKCIFDHVRIYTQYAK